MRCPLCHGYSEVVTTKKKAKKGKPDIVTRYRRCAVCFYQFPTEEKLKEGVLQ